MNITPTIEEIRENLQKTVDKLGNPIDPGIFNTVLYLNALRINTVASCEGHIDWGQPSPWIDIRPQETTELTKLTNEITDLKLKIDEGLAANKTYSDLQAEQSKYLELTSKLFKSTLVEGQKVNDLLASFYEDRKPNYGTNLVLRNIGGSTLRLESATALFQEVLSHQEKMQNLEAFKEEMNLFTNFLKTTYEKLKK